MGWPAVRWPLSLAALAALALAPRGGSATVLAEQQAEARAQALQQGMQDEQAQTRNQNLLSAAKQGDAPKLQQLLQLGADVHTYNPDGFTALYWAAWQGCEPCVELLIDAGADVDEAGLDGASPLIVSAVWGHCNITALLLSEGADPLATREAPTGTSTGKFATNIRRCCDLRLYWSDCL